MGSVGLEDVDCLGGTFTYVCIGMTSLWSHSHCKNVNLPCNGMARFISIVGSLQFI